MICPDITLGCYSEPSLKIYRRTECEYDLTIDITKIKIFNFLCFLSANYSIYSILGLAKDGSARRVMIANECYIFNVVCTFIFNFEGTCKTARGR